MMPLRLLLKNGQLLSECEILCGQLGLATNKLPKKNDDHLYPAHDPLPTPSPNVYVKTHERSCDRGSVIHRCPRECPKPRFLTRIEFLGPTGWWAEDAGW